MSKKISDLQAAKEAAAKEAAAKEAAAREDAAKEAAAREDAAKEAAAREDAARDDAAREDALRLQRIIDEENKEEGNKSHPNQWNMVSSSKPEADEIIKAFDKKFGQQNRIGNVMYFRSEDDAERFFKETAERGIRFFEQQQYADGTLIDKYAISVGDGKLIFGNRAAAIAALSAYKEGNPHYETAQKHLKTLGVQAGETAVFRSVLNKGRAQAEENVKEQQADNQHHAQPVLK